MFCCCCFVLFFSACGIQNVVLHSSAAVVGQNIVLYASAAVRNDSSFLISAFQVNSVLDFSSRRPNKASFFFVCVCVCVCVF